MLTGQVNIVKTSILSVLLMAPILTPNYYYTDMFSLRLLSTFKVD